MYVRYSMIDTICFGHNKYRPMLFWIATLLQKARLLKAVRYFETFHELWTEESHESKKYVMK